MCLAMMRKRNLSLEPSHCLLTIKNSGRFALECASPISLTCIFCAEEKIIVATTHPETMLGDTAVTVHPDDPHYKVVLI
jgi:hypothetical protein